MQPEVVSVLNFDLQAVGFILLIVRIGDKQQIRLNGFRNIHAAESNLCLCAARDVPITHFFTCFHGGNLDALRSGTSGIVSIMPAGNV